MRANAYPDCTVCLKEICDPEDVATDDPIVCVNCVPEPPTLCAICGESIVDGEDVWHYDAQEGGEVHDRCCKEGDA